MTLLKTFKYNKDLKDTGRDFPGHPVVKKPPANAGDRGLIPEPLEKVMKVPRRRT